MLEIASECQISIRGITKSWDDVGRRGGQLRKFYECNYSAFCPFSIQILYFLDRDEGRFPIFRPARRRVEEEIPQKVYTARDVSTMISLLNLSHDRESVNFERSERHLY